jgi:serine/threonine protein kinase
MTIDKIGRYQILGTLGKGAHSTIYHVRRQTDARQYALKVVPIDTADDRKYLEQAQHEFKVAGLLSHPNLVKIYTLETERDWLFRTRKALLLIEYVNGKTVDLWGKLPLAALVQVFERIAAAAVHMHKQGVWHADLKPNNILLSRTGEVKIIDFGLAWIRGQRKGRVQGTPEYMAPETAKSGTINERTDIYNLGATMYRLVTGRLPPGVLPEMGGLPVVRETWEQLLKPVGECCPEAPAPLCGLIHRCLAFDPHRRPARMSEVQGALDHLADELIQSPEDRLEMLQLE